MSWFFSKKRKEAAKYFIPENEIMGLLEMVDKSDNLKTNVTYYALWKKIEVLFPDLDIRSKPYSLHIKGNVLTPYIIEIKEDAK